MTKIINKKWFWTAILIVDIASYIFVIIKQIEQNTYIANHPYYVPHFLMTGPLFGIISIIYLFSFMLLYIQIKISEAILDS